MQNITSHLQRMFNDSGRLLGLMLLSLHGFLIADNGNALHAAFLLSHLGFFLMWQPLSRHSKNLPWFATIAILIGASILVVYINWWFMAFWVAGLFALIAGRIFSTERTIARLPYLLAGAYLLAILLLWIVPSLLNASSDLAAAAFLLTYFLPILPLLILYFSVNRIHETIAADETPNIDFFYTLLIFLTVVIVILGSYIIGIVWVTHYLELLTSVVLGLALALVALSWLWNPSATFSGLELLMSRYLLSLGLPFEQWIRKIAQYAKTESSAAFFLQAAMQELVALHWVSGIAWTAGHTQHRLGTTSAHLSTFSFNELHVSLYSTWQFTPAMYLHVQLLTQILGEFYNAKLREELISQNAYTQALYETGSRLTHDIKNILQSLGTLCAAAEQHQNTDNDAKLIGLMQKQLPLLNQRLGSTLNKFTQPVAANHSTTQANVVQTMPLNAWWEQWTQTHAHLSGAPYFVKFEAPQNISCALINVDVLDSVIENLLQNALNKAKLKPDVEIKIAILAQDGCCVEVSDTGAAIPGEVMPNLLIKPVASQSGLGVGLYHAAQQASQAGYRLSVYQNGLSADRLYGVVFRLAQV